MTTSDHLWHRTIVWLPRRTIEGRWIGLGMEAWRRRRADGRWEYSEYEMPFDEYLESRW